MNSIIRNIFYILVTIIVLPGFSFLPSSALPDCEIQQLNMSNGLADNIITCIYQDKERFMWFGTYNGLSKYDGTNIYNFTIEDTRMYISDIQETSDGKLWIIANSKLYCFDRLKEKFIPVSLANTEEDIPASAMEITNDSLFWIVEAGSLQRLQRTYKNNNVEITIENTYTDLLDENERFLVLRTSKDKCTLYLATDKGNLLFFDKRTRKIVRKIHYSPKQSANATSIIAQEEYIWVSAISGGVTRVHIPTGHLEHFIYDRDKKISSLSHTDTYGIIPINDDSYIAVTWNGYTLFTPSEADSDKLVVKPYTNTSFLHYQNIETRMISAFYDKEGILWIGTRGGGVLYFDFRQHYYKKYHNERHNAIQAQVIDDDGRIWLGTFHEGIMRSTHPYSKSHNLQFSSLDIQKGTPVSCAIKDPRSNLWFGNTAGYLICYKWKSQSIHTYPLRNSRNRINSTINDIFIDSQQRFWVCTSSGLYLFNEKTGISDLVSLHKTLKQENEPFITTICEDKQHNIWLGTYSGLIRLSKSDSNTWEVHNQYEEKNNIKSSIVISLLTDKDGTVYVGYNNGFGVIPNKKEQIAHFYTVKDGLCNDCINCIAQDEEGYIWLGNLSGISRYSRHQHIFYNYYISSSNESVVLYKNTLFWGNNRSLTYFEPKEVISTTIIDDIFYTGLEINNKPVDIGNKVNGQIVLDTNITYAKQLELNNSNRDFSISFSNLSFSKNLQKYSYRLYPYQQNWIVSESGKASYTNLPPGVYTFEARALFPNNTEGSIASLPITIHPHWSQTILFRVLLWLITLLIISYICYYFWHRHHRFEKLMKLKHELAIAHMERNTERQIREERENFFTNAAHELRTPLTLILAPFQDIIQSITPADKWYIPFNKIYKSCLSLQTLVDHLLCVQKIEAGMIKLYLSEWDITQTIEKLANSFRQMAILKNRVFEVKMDIGPINLWIDVEKIESAIQNLLSNAFKYTPQNGKIELRVSEKEFDGIAYCLISVSDTGTGISEDLQQHIFDSFITGKQAPQFSTSIGVGLHIVKHTMDLHHGFVNLTSRIGEGSRFTLYIPKGFSHFEKDEYETIPHPPTESEVKNETIQDIDVPAIEESGYETTNNKDVLLIIEDHDEMRAYLCSLFKDDYHIVTAKDGEEGIWMATQYIPQLIISDIMMPVKDGFECCREIRNNKKTFHIPVIFLTAKSEDNDRLKSLKMGADDYIMKPFNSELLKEKVSSLIKQREQLKRLYTKTLMLNNVPAVSESPKDTFMQEIIQIIEANLSNENFSVKTLADKLNMSQPSLYRKIKQNTNLSIIEVIRGVRMSKAATIIMSQQYTSLMEVAEMVGYDSMNAFRKHFVAQFGVLPSKYIEENKISKED